jgi:RPA family protein
MSKGGFSRPTGSFVREPAIRVFSTELRESRLQFRDGEDEKSPSFILLPTGERCNRIFICGEVTQKEKRGDQNTFYTARFRDPAGLFFLNAGSYQQEAMQQMAKINQGDFAAVVGKPGIRETPDGSIFVTVRVETITRIDKDTYLTWIDDAAEQTLDRLERFGNTDDSMKASEFYNTSTEHYRRIVYESLVAAEI